MDWHRPGGCERAGEGEKYFSQSLLATDTRVTSCSKGGHSLDEYLSDGWIVPQVLSTHLLDSDVSVAGCLLA